MVVFLNSLDATVSSRGGIWIHRKATGTLSRYFSECARLTPTKFFKIWEKSASFPAVLRPCHDLATNTEDCGRNIQRFGSLFMPNYHDFVRILGITPRCLHDNVRNHPELSRMCYGLSRLPTIVWRFPPKYARLEIGVQMSREFISLSDLDELTSTFY
jgi:hypothetical protein